LLPIALFAALAMASTAATAYFAYATLLCKDAHHCKGDETTRFVRLVAMAVCVSNLLGLSALGHLRKLVTTNRKLGLMFWILCRSLSVVTLLVGGEFPVSMYTNQISVKNIYIALFGRVFEGLASDNLLHFTLNAVYAQSKTPDQVLSLISHSLALYMIGISVSPFAVGIFQNFTTSCFIALALFALSFVYLQLCIAEPTTPIRPAQQAQPSYTIGTWIRTALSPLQPFYQKPARLLVGSSLFAYNMVQSYIFTALLVHTSLHFGFTGRENGFIISIAHSVASAYIFISVSLVPRVIRYFQQRQKSTTAPASTPPSTLLALFSLLLQALSLASLGFATRPWHIYSLTIPLAIGLSSPSFIKAAFVSRFDGTERPAALAALAMMETLGSVLGPIMLGGLQSLNSG
ncbi:hypothetical protein DM02DRAFT_474297, partial [Periconia macrospinosa]